MDKTILTILTLLDQQPKVGLAVLGGLNPLAAMEEEAGISTETTTMATLPEYGELGPFQGLEGFCSQNDAETRELIEHLHAKRHQDASTYWSIFSETQQSTF